MKYASIYLITALLSASSWANEGSISCIKFTGVGFCRTHKKLTIDRLTGTSSILVAAQNFYGCESSYDKTTSLDLQDDGTWLSKDGKESLSITEREVRYDDKNLVFDDNDMSPFYYLRSSCDGISSQE